MASQVEAAYCFESVVRGHHMYKTIWTPNLGEILMVFPEPLKRPRQTHCMRQERRCYHQTCSYPARAGEDDNKRLYKFSSVEIEQVHWM